MTWPQDWQTNVTFLLRWAHFLGGITWIGLLYWFNLVNVSFQKEVDASIKGKMNPPLLTRSLWWFRWGAVLTVGNGLIYYAMLLHTENIDAKIGIVLVAWIVAWLLLAGLYRMSVAGGPLKDGRVLLPVPLRRGLMRGLLQRRRPSRHRCAPGARQLQRSRLRRRGFPR